MKEDVVLPEPRGGTPARLAQGALIVATALFMENIDASVLSTSLPEIARDSPPTRFT